MTCLSLLSSINKILRQSGLLNLRWAISQGEGNALNENSGKCSSRICVAPEYHSFVVGSSLKRGWFYVRLYYYKEITHVVHLLIIYLSINEEEYFRSLFWQLQATFPIKPAFSFPQLITHFLILPLSPQRQAENSSLIFAPFFRLKLLTLSFFLTLHISINRERERERESFLSDRWRSITNIKLNTSVIARSAWTDYHIVDHVLVHRFNSQDRWKPRWKIVLR